ncbi:MAG: succinylglutamate desuccinylase/aspartoacylase family protein [Proteobacteria bacterium]|nr:succinylglutamate desuccinylase/aspartoacylase family protein [Pseudomonadota bacterium]
MVQGGIQGDEPSGFISAQLLTQAQVLKGNLIIVPRANVPSINLRKRQVNVDMNRRFDQDYNRFYEDRLARVVRFLLDQSDALIHLHEGSGFYNPTYVDQMHNPKRFGQSIIVDTLNYGDFSLADTVNSALAELNPGIEPEKYRFQLFNTQTFDENSNYKEMRKSLTCYALTEHGIPAVAIELSKDIAQLDWKVRNQVAATVVLLKHYGVIATTPPVTKAIVDSYSAQGINVRINGRPLKAGQVLDLVPGSPLSAEPEADSTHELDPSLALFASDRPGVNLLSAPRMALDKFSNLELFSDGKQVLKTSVRFHGVKPGNLADDALAFVCWLNGQPLFVQDGQILPVVEGDQLIIEGVWGSSFAEILNLKGYVAKPQSNDGQDIGWEIILDPGNFISKYQVNTTDKTIVRFQVVRETVGTPKASFYVDIAPRKVHALRLVDSHGQPLVVPWAPGNDYHLPSGDYVLEDTWSNGSPAKLTAMAKGLPISPGGSFHVPHDESLTMDLRQATTFAPLGTMVFHSSSIAKYSGQ